MDGRLGIYPLAGVSAGAAATLYLLAIARGREGKAAASLSDWAHLLEAVLPVPPGSLWPHELPQEDAREDPLPGARPDPTPVFGLLVLDVCSRPIAEFLSFTDVWRLRLAAKAALCPLVSTKVALARARGIPADEVFERVKTRRSFPQALWATLPEPEPEEAQGQGPGRMPASGIDLVLMESILARPELLQARDCASRTLLIKAVQTGSLETARALLSARSDPNAHGGNGWTPLHFAATGKSAEMCNLLLDHRAEVNKRSADGYAPLFYAQRAGDPDVLKLLLHRGASRSSDARIFYMTPTGSDG